MKLELKHLAGYLPYELKINTQYGIDVPKQGHIYTMIGCSYKSDKLMNGKEGLVFEVKEKYNKEMSNGYFSFKPILHPLSDYEKFDEIVLEMTTNETDMIDDNPDLVKRLSYDVIDLMFKNHIDILGLIGSGLAIDINTLNK